MRWCADSIWVTNTRVLAGLAYCRLFVGLHGPRVPLNMPKTFEDLEAMSVT